MKKICKSNIVFVFIVVIFFNHGKSDMLNYTFRFFTYLITAFFILFCVAFAGKESSFSSTSESGNVSRVVVSDIKVNQSTGGGKAPAEAVEPNIMLLSLNDLIVIALKNNQMIEVVKQRAAQSAGQLTMAQSGYLPQLALEGRYFYTERQDSAASNVGTNADGQSIPISDETEEDDIVHGAFNISQLIYDFGKTTGAIDVGRANVQAADFQLQRQLQDILFQVKQAYYNVLEKRRLIDVAAESVKNFQQHLERANIYYKTGIRTKIDVINAEVELSRAKMNLIRTKYNLKTARVALEQVLGKKPNRGQYSVYDDGVNVDNVLASMPPVQVALEDLIQFALEQRPDLLQLKQLTEAARGNLKSAQGDYWPSIKAEARYNDYDTSLSLYKDSWEVGVAASWKIFAGLHTQGAVAEARGGVLENKALLQDLQLTITSEVTESYLNADENRESVQIALQTLGLAKENLTLAQKRYESGSYDVIEFNDAQLSLTRTQSELVVTYYNYLTAFAGIEHAVGKQLEGEM